MTSSALTSTPGAIATNAYGYSSASASRAPITAASAIAGWVSSTASSSAGGTWYPLYLISSLTRSTMYQLPLSSTLARWPVCSQPSASPVASVASECPSQPSITGGPRASSSPVWPTPRSSAVATSISRHSVRESALPTLPGSASVSSLGITWETGESSVIP